VHRLRDGRPPACNHMPHEIFGGRFFENLASLVECIHCERTFKLGDAIWDPKRNFWCCAFPGCSGTLIDFVPASVNHRRHPRGSNPRRRRTNPVVN
jgi:hypothetical protein